jgi:hypothetical protein
VTNEESKQQRETKDNQQRQKQRDKSARKDNWNQQTPENQ